MRALSHPDRSQLRLGQVLEALANPLRLRIVRSLAADEKLTCGTVLPDVPASSASHHWRVLREGGIVHARREGRIILHTLRREDLDARFPGLLDVVLTALDAEQDHGMATVPGA